MEERLAVLETALSELKGDVCRVERLVRELVTHANAHEKDHSALRERLVRVEERHAGLSKLLWSALALGGSGLVSGIYAAITHWS